jgi:Flp pilus assembly protein protease CpaA
MPTTLVLIIAAVILLVGTITDLKTREVPDWLNFAGIAAGLGIFMITAYLAKDFKILLTGLIGFAIFVALGYLMYYTGQWGGGDSKLAMALGALFGLEFSINHFAVEFLANLLIAGAVYGVLWVLILAARNWKKVFKQIRELSKQKQFMFLRIFSIIALAVLIIMSFTTDDTTLSIMMLVLAIFFPVITYLSLLIKSVEKTCMLREANPSELVEGDWIAKDVMVKGKKLAGPKDLGVSKKQIAELKKHNVKVIVKDGIPFVPSFLIAFILALLIGNPILLLV